VPGILKRERAPKKGELGGGGMMGWGWTPTGGGGGGGGRCRFVWCREVSLAVAWHGATISAFACCVTGQHVAM